MSQQADRAGLGGPEGLAGVPSVRAVVRDAPAAVLMVDLAKRQVVHVNDVAEQLAPGARLPVDLDVWSDAAQLRDLDGAELSETMHPLSRVARAEPVAGQAVSAARRSALGGRREPLWVVALPMRGAPMLDGHALVALIPLHQAGNVAESAADQSTYDGPTADLDIELRDRAVAATALSFTVADVLSPDQPLVWVNPAFTATTGYELDEVVGRNCRFLQGPETDPQAGRLMREAITQGVSTSVTLVNYRKDGTPFWNQVDLSPVRDAEGRVAHFVGIQTDVTQRVLSDRRTAEALRAEQEARADAEAARARLAFLFEGVNRLSATLDESEFVQRLLSMVVPYMADWAVFFRTGPQHQAATIIGRHRDPAREAELEDYVAAIPSAMRAGHPVDLLLGGERVRMIDLSDTSRTSIRGDYLEDFSLVDRTRSLDGQVAMVVGLPGRSQVSDVLVLVRNTGRETFTDDDVSTALDLSSRAGLVLENVGLYQAQARIAEVLQRSLLPDLPDVTSVRAAARYIANETGAEIGGDFYELLDLGEDGIGLAIGDVTGHDILAAAAMGHLKGLLRASALDAYQAPAAVLSKVDHLVLGLGMPTIASAIFAHAVPRDDEWELTWSNAGHLPLLVRRPDGTAEVLASTTGVNDTLLGIGERPRAEHRVRLPRGSTVIAYTDGLVERRGRLLDEGIDMLLETARTAPTDLEALSDHLVGKMSAELGGLLDDDVALLAVHLP